MYIFVQFLDEEIMYNHLLIICFFWNVFFVQSQPVYTVRGIVKDSITNFPLASVSISLEGESHATVSNRNGVFHLPTLQQMPVIRVERIGYEEKQITLALSENQDEVVVILLSPKIIELDEVITRRQKTKYSKKNNPAIELIKKIIIKKNKFAPTKIPYYHCEEYERKSLALSDFTPDIRIRGYDFLHDYTDVSKIDGKTILWLSIKERISDVYFRKKMRKEVTKGIHYVGMDESFDQVGVDAILNELFAGINIFNNDIRFLTTRFVSPLSDMATLHYKFYIEDTVCIDNRQYLDLEFFPYGTESAGLAGHIFVTNDTAYAIKKIQLHIPADTRLNYVNNLHVEQNFEQQANGLWLLVNEHIIVDFYLLRALNGFYAETNRIYRNFVFAKEDEPVFDFQGSVFVLPDAEHYPTEHWECFRHQGMTPQERAVAAMMDELHQKKSFNLSERLINILTTGYIPTHFNGRNLLDVGKISSFVSFNDIEDWRFRLDFRTTVDLNQHWYMAGYAAYGLRDKRLKYYGDVRYSFNKRRGYINEFPMNNIGIFYKYDLETPGQSGMLSRDHFLMSFTRDKNDKMAYVRHLSLFYQKELLNDFSYDLQLNYRKSEPTGNLFFHKQNGTDIIPIPGITTTTLDMNLIYSPGQKFYQTTGARIRVSPDSPIFTLSQRIGGKGILGSDYNLIMTELSATKRFWLSAFGHINTEMNAGKIWNQAPYPLLFFPNANTSYVTGTNSFNMMKSMEFINDQYMSFFMTYHARGWILNKIPLIKKLKLREVFSFKLLWGDSTDVDKLVTSSTEIIVPVDETNKPISYRMGQIPYMEISVGIENIFKIFRFDYGWRLSYLNRPNTERQGWQFSLNFAF
ncbi:MAG: DUF5686 and carboxypeptidase regulatory-like domain-containing protein [Bacteroidales bacterium]|jgi:hypothetical protein|nr:DUF5686 and carboxypeptidase regulatory-like domain-containing protein [Bacteroidales bacterium]